MLCITPLYYRKTSILKPSERKRKVRSYLNRQ